MRTNTDEINALAEIALNYLISAPEELARFLGYTGLDGDSLRQGIGSPSLSLGLFDYFAQNEPALLAMCANGNLPPERFMRGWHQLNPGG